MLHHVVQGGGPTVVLLHAGVADLRMWDDQAHELERDHTVVRCDLSGFGGSPVGTAHSDAEDVLGLLEHLQVDRLDLVAASFGGHVALQVATAAPHRVERLVLLAPLAQVVEPDEALQGFWAEEARLVEAGDLDGATELNLRTLLGPDAEDAARDRLRVMHHDALVLQVAAGEIEDRELPVALDRLGMPTTVVVGARDLSFFRETARALVEALPAARLVELDWAGHLPSLERPLETARLVREVLAAG